MNSDQIKTSWETKWQKIVNSIEWASDIDDKEALIKRITQDVEKPKVVAFVNAHSLNMAAKDSSFASNLVASDYLLRDGIGVHLLARLNRIDPGLNLNGTDLIPEILRNSHRRKVAVWGTTEPWLSLAAKDISSTYGLSVISKINGFADPTCYLDAMNEYQPEILILGMGMPKQEMIAQRIRHEFPETPVLIICGGAILDFLGGRVPRASPFLRKLGLEWAHRLLLEPRRLASRYILGIPAFVLRSVLLKFSQGREKPF